MATLVEGESTNPVEVAMEPQGHRPTVEMRMAEGKSMRQQLPRRAHAAWWPLADRPDPVDLLKLQDETRIPDLVPIRYGRLSDSPFAFLRGSATVMAQDLGATPVTGWNVQACGDAHLSNFGGFATPERTLVFDINDFDETLPGPWEWDVKRLATSFVVAGRANGHSAADCADAARSAVRSYRERMAAYAPMGHLEVWYSRITAADASASLPKAIAKDYDRGARRATHRDSLQLLSKITTYDNGRLRILDDPPLVVHFSDEVVGDNLPLMAKAYGSSIRDDLRALLDQYTFVDFARKVVGVGSVGTRCYIVLMEGNHNQDPLFLQIKEATESVLAPYAGKSIYKNQGQRVVAGQHQIQAASDIFLGWGRVKGVDFYVRQLRDMKVSVDVTAQTSDRMNVYAGLCGWALARAHARSGDPARISGYLGRGEAFDDAVVSFAIAYADQTERDHAALLAGIKSGKVAAISGL
jgi:uncharacterized protein (DUF2252 family)